MAKLQPGLVVRVKPDSKQVEAMQRLLTCNGESHDGWETAGRPFLVTRKEGGEWRLCPICSDPETGKGLPRPVPLGVGEAGVLRKLTYLHVAVSTLVPEKYVNTWTVAGPKKRLAGFQDDRKAELLAEFNKHWPMATETPSQQELEPVR